ncbi:glycoprotein, partial [Prochlorococcus marinus str. MU1405]|nr:glycoprotein [Prochlorococcus marinus str. MU1405]MBW3047439.1 glycoprotein [Prochlorococcus marinus str. MU1406]
VGEEENQEQITLIDEVGEEENQEQIKLESSKTFENIEETKWESNGLETASSNGISSKNQNHNKINKFTETPKLPLPYIKNLRKWINNDKKAS